MGFAVEVFVERFVDNVWHEVGSLRASLEMDFVQVLRKKRSLLKRGIPHNVSAGVEQALTDLGEEFADESWATLEELLRLPFEDVVKERRLLGPMFWLENRERGTRATPRGSHVDEGTQARLARFGARLVSNEEMDEYVESDAFAAETRGLTDGECKVFTIVVHSRSLADRVGFARTIEAMRSLGRPDCVRIVWTIGP